MTKLRTLKKIKVGDIILHYLISTEKQVEWMIYPASMKKQACLPDYERTAVSLLQAKLFGDPYDKNFSNGMTMFNSQTARTMTFVSQVHRVIDNTTIIETRLKDKHGNLYVHQVRWRHWTRNLVVRAAMINRTTQSCELDFLPSFTLNGISPFAKIQKSGTLELIRMRSKWSMEGRIERRPVEDYDLEESWKASGIALVQFGQNGTMPVRRFFPIVGVYDCENNVTWLAKLDARASWQLNAARVDDRLVLFGGLPDDDNGRWHKKLEPGEIYWSPAAYLTVGKGDFLNVSQRLLAKAKKNDLSIIYNEWGTTWGHPSAKLINDSSKLLASHGVGTYVIDAGWYKSCSEDFNEGIGDWTIDKKKFPDGLKSVVENIHAHGMKAGLWFEFECLGKESSKYKDSTMLVTRRDWPVTTLKRRFFDMRKLTVNHYLKEKVMAQLDNNHFDYLKVDYNDSIGVGADGADSDAEGLQQEVSATIAFLVELKRKIPRLVIENCSSGGHRLTPAFIDVTDLSSFSDAHKTTSIPIIAANELNVVPAAKNLIWCLLQPSDSICEIQYQLIAAFLGRICLSGDVRNLTASQWQTVDLGLAFYHRIVPLITSGQPLRQGPDVLSYRAPTGYQISGFIDGMTVADSHKILLVIHRFGGKTPTTVPIMLQNNGWQVAYSYGDTRIDLKITDKNAMLILPETTFCARAILLTRTNKI